MDCPAPPSPRTPEARRELARFSARYRREYRRLQDVALSILVWGPDLAACTPVAQKRREIRETLLREGHNAMFSEDLADGAGSVSMRTLELAQARAAHLVIVLYGESPGAIAETHDICTHPEIAPKVLVIIPRRYRSGYAGRGALRDLEDAHGGVFWYTDEDLAACRVCARALTRARALRHLHAGGGAA